MKVSVRLFANLREHLPDAPRGAAELELEPGASLADLLAQLAIESDRATMVLVNGERSPRDAPARAALVLSEGDDVAIFPPLAGG